MNNANIARITPSNCKGISLIKLNLNSYLAQWILHIINANRTPIKYDGSLNQGLWVKNLVYLPSKNTKAFISFC